MQRNQRYVNQSLVKGLDKENQPVKSGRLKLNMGSGRYEFHGQFGECFDLTSGDMVYLYDPETEAYLRTRIEYSHDKKRYYATFRDDMLFHDAACQLDD